MDLLHEAIRGRRIAIRNANLTATLDRLKANPPTLVDGQRVRIHPDAPLKTKFEVLLGRTGTVDGKPSRGKATVVFDPDQPLGPLTDQDRATSRCGCWSP